MTIFKNCANYIDWDKYRTPESRDDMYDVLNSNDRMELWQNVSAVSAKHGIQLDSEVGYLDAALALDEDHPLREILIQAEYMYRCWFSGLLD